MIESKTASWLVT